MPECMRTSEAASFNTAAELTFQETAGSASHSGRRAVRLPPVGREKIIGPAPACKGGGDELTVCAFLCKGGEDELPAFPLESRNRVLSVTLSKQPFRRKAGTGDLFRLSCRKSCLRMPHSPDRTATTAWSIHPSRSFVSFHFSGIPTCPIRLRVLHPSSFPKESGIGRPGTAGQSTVCQSGKQGGCPAFIPPPP
jgi:hypothetical protein